MDNNKELSKIFSQMADILDIQGANVFRVRAYRRAVQLLDSLSEDVSKLRMAGTLKELPGIGEGMAALISEYLDTRQIADFDRLKASIPRGLLDLLQISDLGPKKVGLLYKELNVIDIPTLEKATRKGKVKMLPGMGEKTEANILKGIEFLKKGSGRTHIGEALPLAESIISELKKLKEIKQIDVAGSIRRGKETVKDMDILVVSSKPAKIMDAFTSLPEVEKVIGKGETKSSIRFKSGIQSDLRVVEKGSYGAAMQYFTGSKSHNVMLRSLANKKGFKINEYGVFKISNNKKVAGASEEDIYKILGLQYIPPELREGLDEIERARTATLPNLITIDDIAGDLHTHTNWTDGKNALEEMVKAAKRKGYKYVAITDHSQSTYVANGMSQDRLKKQIDLLNEVNEKIKGIEILKGIELDIRMDGKLDFPDSLLINLDIVVISIHTGFKQSETEMTNRICRALRNENSHIFAHPTGRLINRREAYKVKIEQVMELAVETGTAMELNAHYLRLDLNDLYLKRAKEIGVTISINSDSHSTDGFNQMRYGIMAARRAGLEAKDVLNTGSLNKVKKFCGRH